MIKRSSEPFHLIILSLFDSQLPGEFHGGCSRRLHARQQAPWPASYYSPSNLHCPNTHYLPPGQTSKTDHASSAGGGGGASKPYHLPRAVQYAVPWVSQLYMGLFAAFGWLWIQFMYELLVNQSFVCKCFLCAFISAACSSPCKWYLRFDRLCRIFYSNIKKCCTFDQFHGMIFSRDQK